MSFEEFDFTQNNFFFQRTLCQRKLAKQHILWFPSEKMVLFLFSMKIRHVINLLLNHVNVILCSSFGDNFLTIFDFLFHPFLSPNRTKMVFLPFMTVFTEFFKGKMSFYILFLEFQIKYSSQFSFTIFLTSHVLGIFHRSIPFCLTNVVRTFLLIMSFFSFCHFEPTHKKR